MEARGTCGRTRRWAKRWHTCSSSRANRWRCFLCSSRGPLHDCRGSDAVAQRYICLRAHLSRDSHGAERGSDLVTLLLVHYVDQRLVLTETAQVFFEHFHLTRMEPVR